MFYVIRLPTRANSDRKNFTPKGTKNKTDFSWGFPALSPVQSPDLGRCRETELHMDPMDLEINPQVDRRRC